LRTKQRGFALKLLRDMSVLSWAASWLLLFPKTTVTRSHRRLFFSLLLYAAPYSPDYIQYAACTSTVCASYTAHS
jgi:hypothetical protein